MTRKEELLELARRVAYECIDSPTGEAEAQEIFKALRRVEREVWAKCAEKIESLMEHENESTDDQIWELRDWCKQRQEGL